MVLPEVRAMAPLAAVVVSLIAVVFSATAKPRATDHPTALDRYVAAPDPSYAWKLAISLRDESATGYALDLTSQHWLTTISAVIAARAW